jgi:hypothetical protein
MSAPSLPPPPRGSVMHVVADARPRSGPRRKCQGLANGCTCHECAATLSLIASHRKGCTACDGDPTACLSGTPSGERLKGCKAFTPTGKVRATAAKATPRQPWQAKAA